MGTPPQVTGATVSAGSDLPFVSVVMPVRDESEHVGRSVGAVLAQRYPAERYEVIVADGYSGDATPSIVESFKGRLPSLILIDNPGRTAAAGLNAAFGVARGEIIVRVDGHCEIASDYLLRCVEHLRRDHVDGVGGPVQAVGETCMAGAIAAATSSVFGVGDSAFRTVKDRTMLTDTVAFPAYTRAVIERAGPYDEELVRNQDDEYNCRLRKLGARLLLAADVRSRYHARGTLGRLAAQYFQYGFWKVRVMQKHPRQMSRRHFVPAIFVLSLLTTGVLAWRVPRGLLPLSAILGAYLAASLISSLAAARRSRWAHFPVLPVVFATLHLSYGLGFLTGLVRFAHRWGAPGRPDAAPRGGRKHR